MGPLSDTGGARAYLRLKIALQHSNASEDPASECRIVKWMHPCDESCAESYSPLDAMELRQKVRASTAADERAAARWRSASEHRSTTEEDVRLALGQHFKTLPAAFSAFDSDGDGLVSFQDFTKGLALAPLGALPVGTVERLWQQADVRGEGFLSLGRLGAFIGMVH